MSGEVGASDVSAMLGAVSVSVLGATVEVLAGLGDFDGLVVVAPKVSSSVDMQMTPPLWQKVKRN